MMSNTIDKNSKNNSTKWKTEILLHIELFEKFFPELREFAHSPTVVRVYPKYPEIQPDQCLICHRSGPRFLLTRVCTADSRLEIQGLEGPTRAARDHDLYCASGSHHVQICNHLS
jgi:hypothetical protein